MSKDEDRFQNILPELGRFAEESFINEEEQKKSGNSDFSKQYEFIENIAQGGLKDIFRVRDCKAGRDIAMAYLRKDRLSPANNERFLREARILASLEHANIIPLYEIDYDNDNQLYFTTKLLTGETLYSVLKKINEGNEAYAKEYSLRRLIDIFMDVCDAMSYSHSEGIVHLDLKPENIQITKYNEVAVMDWGFAKFSNDHRKLNYRNNDLATHTPLSENLTQVGTVNGTPGYLSPEQASNREEDINETSDIYSLGAVLYSILYLHRPYHDLSVEEITEATANGKELNFPEKAREENVPNALIAIVKKAMHHERDMRYRKVEDLKKDITLYLNDHLTEAEDINLLKFSKLFIKRHKNNIIIACIVLMIISGIIYTSYTAVREHVEIAEIQNLKVNATADEIVQGTLNKHRELRASKAYSEIIANYEKLRSVGYNYPEFWLDEAKLYAGELNFKKARYALEKLKEFETSIISSEAYDKMLSNISDAENITDNRDLSIEELMTYSINMDSDTQNHIIWNMNRNPNIDIEEKLELLGENIKRYNKHIPNEDVAYSYKIDDDYITVDLSNNPGLGQPRPIIGLPIKSINLSNTNVNFGAVSRHLKKELLQVNISNNNKTIYNSQFQDASYRKFIARNTLFSADDVRGAKYLNHLDIEGAIVLVNQIRAGKQLEYLNIAFTKIKSLEFIKKLSGLKTLVIDDMIKLPGSLNRSLKENNVSIIVKKNQVIHDPGLIEAENYNSMLGVQTEKTQDSSGIENVGWIDPGDILTYSIFLTEAGIYHVDFRVAGPYFDFELLREEEVLATVKENGSGGYQKWTTITRAATLPAGASTITLLAKGGDWNINWIELTLVNDSLNESFVKIPARIQAEDYISMHGVETQETKDSDGELNIGWVDRGDYLTYNIEADKGGLYEVSFRLAGTQFQFKMTRDNEVLFKVKEKGTTDWQDWTTIKRTIKLPAGRSTLSILATGKRWNFNWMEFKYIGPGEKPDSGR